jgi:hypothetical protein
MQKKVTTACGWIMKSLASEVKKRIGMYN